MEILGTDLMEFHGHHALVLLDYFSGYVFFDPVSAATSQEVINALKTNLRKFGQQKDYLRQRTMFEVNAVQKLL